MMNKSQKLIFYCTALGMAMIFSSCQKVSRNAHHQIYENIAPVPFEEIHPELTITTTTLNLESAVAIASINNPELQAALHHLSAVQEKIPQVSTLSDPTVNFGGFIEEIQTRTGEQEYFAGISQKFPWFGKLMLKSEMANADYQVALQKYYLKTIEINLEVTQAYHNLAYQQSAFALAQEEKQYLNQFLESATATYASGKSSRQEVLKAQTEISRVDSDLLGYPSRITTYQAQLNRLMNRVIATTITLVKIDKKDHFFKLKNSSNKKNHPKVRELQRKLNKAESQLKLARKDFWPDLTLGVNYFGIGDNSASDPRDEGDDAWNVTLGFNIPLRNNRRKAQLREADYLKKKYSREKEAEHDRLEEKHESIYKRLESLDGQLKILEKSLLPLAQELYETSQADYTSGKGTFLDLLDAERTLLRVRHSEIQLLRDFRLAIAESEFVIDQGKQPHISASSEEPGI